MRIGLTCLLLSLLACSDNGPSNDLPPLGRYTFTFDAANFDAAGHLVITNATADQLTGRWEAPQLLSELRQGGWNVDAWLMGGTPFAGGGIISIRVVHDEDTGLRCVSGRFNSASVSQAATCSTRFVGE